MVLDKIVEGSRVRIKAGIKSMNLDYNTVFDKDIIGTVFNTNGENITIDIPGFYKLRTYRISDVEVLR